MNCQQINELIYDYCDGNVTPEIAAVIEKHLHECPFCRNNEKLTQMENEALYYVENSPVLLPGFTEKVMATINTGYYNTNPGLKNSWSGLNRLRKYIPSMAVVVLILLIVAAGSIFNKSDFNSTTRVADNDNQLKSMSTQKFKQDLIKAGSASSLNQANKSTSLSTEDNETNKALNSSIDKKAQDTPVAVSYDSEQPVSKAETSGTVLKSPQSPRISSVQSSRGAGSETMRLEPVNIPTKYELTGISSDGQNTTFSYSGSQETSNFKVSISPQVTEEMFKTGSYEATNAGINSCQPTILSGTLSSPVSWKITSKNQVYVITLTGNLSPEELQSLARSIGFAEKPFAANWNK
ncbi:MAG: zf-HC2 domain-containing protein [Syntrophomonas sp.]